jgi:membrane protease YdiL (CAAX protease family)
LSEPFPEIGEPIPNERRNPIGWLLFAALAAFLIIGQLNTYLHRTPSTAVARAELEDRLQTLVRFEGLPGGLDSPTSLDAMVEAAAPLKPSLAKDPESALLYAAVLTEAKKPIAPIDLAALHDSKDATYKAAYEIYSSPSLTATKAAELARQIPPTQFLNRLVSAQALEKGKVPDARRGVRGAGEGSLKTEALAVNFAFMFLGFMLLIAYCLARAGGALAPMGLALGNLSEPDADRVATRSSQLLTTFLVVSFFVGLALALVLPKKALDVPVYLVVVLAALMLSKVPVDGKLITLRRLGLSKEKLGGHVLWGIFGAIANLPILFAVQIISGKLFSSLPPPEHPVTVELSEAISPWFVLQIAVTAGFLAPILEELVFRGTLFPALAAVVKSPLVAGIVSCLIFAAIHPTGIPAWPGLAAIGGMSCFLAYQTRSLVPSITMHCVHNLATLALTLIMLR